MGKLLQCCGCGAHLVTALQCTMQMIILLHGQVAASKCFHGPQHCVILII